MLTWEIAAPDAAEDVAQFYHQNGHRHIAFRPAETMKSVAKGRCVICRDPNGIVAAGVLMPAQNDTWELGQGRVLPSGHGLYKQLITLRTVLAIHLNPATTHVFCEVDEPNVKSVNSFLALGFQPFQPSQKQREASLMLLPKEKRPENLGFDFTWLSIPRAEIEQRMRGAWRRYFSIDRAGNQPVILSHKLAEMLDQYDIHLRSEAINGAS